MPIQRWDLISELIKRNNYKVIAEIGVNKGINALEILKQCQNILKRFYLIDTDISKVFEYDGWFRKYEIARFIRLESKQAVKCIEDNELDLVYIDASHSYENVKQDIELWFPKIKVGGIICGHDYDSINSPGVVRAVNEKFKYFNLEEDALKPDTLKNWWIIK